MHFGESVKFIIERRTAERAAALLEKLEERMDLALQVGGRNPLSGIYDKVIKFAKLKGGVTKTDIWVTFIDEFASEQEVDALIEYLLISHKLGVKNDKLYSV